MTEEIIVTKESEQNTFSLYASSSDGDSDVQIRKTRAKPKESKQFKTSKTPDEYKQYNKPIHNTRMRDNPPEDMLDMFSNPEKKFVSRPDKDIDMSPQESEKALSDLGYPPGDSYDEGNFEEEYEERPSDGFDTLEEEKQDLLYKFYRMQSKGIPVSKKFNMSSDVHEMRREYTKIVRDMEVNGSIKFSRRMLMACVTGIEFLNKRYDPFEVKLEGWSETMMDNMDDYDNVFERLHDKYSSKIQMAPEIELMLSVAGSAFMFHLSNSLMGNLPNLQDIAKSNPDIINNLMKSMSNVQTKPSKDNTSQETTSKREMKGPMFDMSAVMGVFNNASQSTARPLPPVTPPPVPIPMIAPQSTEIVNNNNFGKFVQTAAPTYEPVFNPPSRALSVVSSSDESDITLDVKTISMNESTTSGKGKRGRKTKQIAPEKTISI